MNTSSIAFQSGSILLREGLEAILVIAALFAMMQRLAFKLPLKPVFIATSALLFIMGLRFIGPAIQECQEQVSFPVHSVPLPQGLIDIGLNPSWEAIGAQAAAGALAVLSTAWLMRLRVAAT